MNKQHKCEHMPEEVVIYFTDHYTSDRQWFLFISETAKERDLELSTEINTVGEFLWQTAFNIRFCPYCSEKLDMNNGELHFHKAVNYKLL
ncbi:hypothetical protein FLM06_10235 [Vibrio cholerae]|uniref:hypothetical protein n=1 Tax=Vibrio cholerae TaxID=666 RepID=UPI00115B53D8|nr:hypothetical protein [Vibrio cholerae]TQO82351.1 hypothetical protein FLM06_10235 [Vibrio cholerae]TQP40733.1 hypothetical protein FLL99_18680 [Vibrio cholerae]